VMDRRARSWLQACAALGLALTLAGPAQAESDSGGGLPVEQVEKIVREYLMREPEIIYQALEELQRRQADAAAERQRTAVAANRAQLFEQSIDPVAGNPDGNVTVVEFFDYQCQYCRRVVPALQALLKEDQKLKLVFKEFPILGEASVTAARASLAARCVAVRGRLHAAVADVDAKLRYGSPAVAARVQPAEDGFLLRLEQPVYAVARGQTAVLYDGDVVVGAGVVTSAQAE